MSAYTWAQVETFTAGRAELEEDVSEWDLFQWAIEETLCANPLANSHPLGEDTDLLYFRTWAHPGTAQLPRLVVVFRIDREPAGDTPGLLEGHFIVPFSDLDDDDVPRVVPFLAD
jgi:hypothetical protein